MKPLLVVDGYNVIGAWEQAAQKRWPIEESRERLAARIEEYSVYHGYEAVLVFDGTRSERRVRSEETVGEVRVVYTRHGETADQFIERLCDIQPRFREVRVATNDSVEQTIIFGRGATRVTARELLREMAQSQAVQRAQLDKPSLKRNPLLKQLSPEMQETLERMRRGE